MSREELAWAAGFFDGEGSFSSGNGQLTTPVIEITQVDRRVLDRFLAVIGVGKVYGPYGPYPSSKTIRFRYAAHGFEKVQHAYAIMYIFLSQPKRKQGARILKRWRDR